MTRRKPTAQEKARAREAADRAEGKKPKPARKRKAKEPEPEPIPEITERELREIEEEVKATRDKRIGNEFWKARSSHGRKPKFESPEQLKEACEEYFQWVADHPIYERKPFAFQGSITWADIPMMRGMTLEGLCTFLDITVKTWRTYKKQKDFISVITQAEQVMDTQKLVGAMADQLNPNLVARYIGLKDANTHEHTGKDGGPIETKGEMGDIELARRAGFMIGQAIEKQKHDKKVKEPTDE